MRTVDRIDGFQRRHPALGYPLGVAYKFFDDQGAYLAALITYYGFLSLLPLLLLLSSFLGFITENNPELKEQLVNSVLSQIPVLGRELTAPAGLQGSIPSVIFGSLVALYGGLGIAQAMQNMSNSCWNVPRNHRPNPILMRVRSAAVLLFLGVTLITVGYLPSLWSPLQGSLGVIVNLVLGVGLFLLLMKMTAARQGGWAVLLPGAIFMTLVWQLFVKVAPFFLEAFKARQTDTYGGDTSKVFGGVLALLIAGFILSFCLVLATEMNVVLKRHLYPRALLTPFTDNVELTLADQQAYTLLARMQRMKGFEYIDVLFDKDGDGIADQPSDLVRRWEDARAMHESDRRYGHPRRPSGMWGLNPPPDQAHGSDEGPVEGSE